MDPVEKRRVHEHERAWVVSLLAAAQSKEWFGTITIKMQGGRVTQSLHEEVKIPPKLPPS